MLFEVTPFWALRIVIVPRDDEPKMEVTISPALKLAVVVVFSVIGTLDTVIVEGVP